VGKKDADKDSQAGDGSGTTGAAKEGAPNANKPVLVMPVNGPPRSAYAKPSTGSQKIVVSPRGSGR
jgi:hypothetical protein